MYRILSPFLSIYWIICLSVTLCLCVCVYSWVRVHLRLCMCMCVYAYEYICVLRCGRARACCINLVTNSTKSHHLPTFHLFWHTFCVVNEFPLWYGVLIYFNSISSGRPMSQACLYQRKICLLDRMCLEIDTRRWVRGKTKSDT